MLALSVWLAVRDAISSLSDYRLSPVLDAPTTPDRILAAVDEMMARASPLFFPKLIRPEADFSNGAWR